MEPVVVLALLAALGALVVGDGPVAGDGSRPPAMRDPPRPAGTGRRTTGRPGRRPSRSPRSAQGKASVRRPQGASALPARPAPPYRVKVGCCPRCARLRQHGC
jgi:hypothetical protein